MRRFQFFWSDLTQQYGDLIGSICPRSAPLLNHVWVDWLYDLLSPVQETQVKWEYVFHACYNYFKHRICSSNPCKSSILMWCYRADVIYDCWAEELSRHRWCSRCRLHHNQDTLRNPHNSSFWPDCITSWFLDSSKSGLPGHSPGGCVDPT